MPVAYISTNVVTNGSSGSVHAQRQGRAVRSGYRFATAKVLGSDFMVEREITRSIHVDSATCSG